MIHNSVRNDIKKFVVLDKNEQTKMLTYTNEKVDEIGTPDRICPERTVQEHVLRTKKHQLDIKHS